MVRRFVYTVVLSLALVLPGAVFAQEKLPESSTPTPEFQEVEKQAVNPGDDLRYTLKRLKEKITLVAFSFSSTRKANYYEKLLQVRLAELKYVVGKKDIANIQTTSQRYSTTVGELTELVLKDKRLNYRKERTRKLLSSHLPVVEKLREAYNDTTAEWRFVEHDANYLRIYSAQLSD